MRMLLIASHPDSILAFRGALISAMLDKGIDVHVAAPDLDAESIVCDTLKSMKVTAQKIPMDRHGVSPIADLTLLWHLTKLMRRIQPDDATEQLHNVFYALKPGGRYLCVTPSPLNGPHDISAGFDDTASCFHLKEYTVSELATLFRGTGFSDIGVVMGFGGRFFRCPLPVVTGAEKLVSLLPAKWAKAVAGAPLVRNVLYPRLIGTKPV